MFDIPIKSKKQAEVYFKTMGCLHFHMEREFPQRYEEYQQLNITQQQEKEWMLERFDDFYGGIMQAKSDTALWIVHSHMAELFEHLRIEVALYGLPKAGMKWWTISLSRLFGTTLFVTN